MKIIEAFQTRKSPVEIQIDDIQKSVVLTAKSVLRKIEHSIAVCEANDNKPETIYRDLMDSKWQIKNLVYDLENDH